MSIIVEIGVKDDKIVLKFTNENIIDIEAHTDTVRIFGRVCEVYLKG